MTGFAAPLWPHERLEAFRSLVHAGVGSDVLAQRFGIDEAEAERRRRYMSADIIDPKRNRRRREHNRILKQAKWPDQLLEDIDGEYRAGWPLKTIADARGLDYLALRVMRSNWIKRLRALPPEAGLRPGPPEAAGSPASPQEGLRPETQTPEATA